MLPLLSKFNNSFQAGLGFMTLKGSAAGSSKSTSLWGPVIGWAIGKPMFSKLSFEAGVSWFITSTEVTNALGSGRDFLQRQTRTTANMAMQVGVLWRF